MRKALTLIVCLLVASVGAVLGHTIQSTTAAANDVTTALNQLFGSAVEAATNHQPYFFVGDFNGDGFKDLLVLVKIKATDRLPKSVTKLNPWGYERNDSSGTSNLALIIIHGGKGGWEALQHLSTYLLRDRDYFSTPIWETTSQDSLISIKKKATAKRTARKAPRQGPKGDTIKLATEAGIDITLSWNGKTYRIDAPNEEP